MLKKKQTKEELLAYHREYRKNNIEKVKEQQRKCYRKNPLKTRDRKLKEHYGISLEEYNIMLMKQNHKCAICGLDEVENIKALAVDHCHKTGEIRGLLCHQCNVGLGCFKDDIDLMTKAINYLT